MPRYDYECYVCEYSMEVFCNIDERPEHIRCPKCEGGIMRQVIITPPATFLDDDCSWAADAGVAVSKMHRHGQPITNRTQFKDFMKKNPQIQPADGPNLSAI